MTTHTKRTLNWTFWAMLGVLLLAAYLRIHDLNAQGLWGDEGWSIWLARGDTLRDLNDTMIVDHHGVIFSAMLRGWDWLVGPTVVALRMLAVLWSIASIALMYRLGAELINPAAGVGAALAFTLMDKHVVLTQEVRDYPQVFFVMLATAYFYQRWRRGKRGAAFGFVFWAIFGLYLHYYTYMVVIAILLHALITLRAQQSSAPTENNKRAHPWRHFLVLNALIALAFVPWLPVVVHQFVWTPVDDIVLTTHGMPFTWDTIDYLARESFGTPVALYGLLMLVGFAAPFLNGRADQFTAEDAESAEEKQPHPPTPSPPAGRGFRGGVGLLRTNFSWPLRFNALAFSPPGPLMDQPPRKRQSAALLIGLWFAVPLLITFGLHSRYPLITDRNISVIMPAIALLVGFGFTAFERYGGAFIVALVLVNGLLTTSSYFDKPPWREMAQDVAAYYPGGEPVLLEVEGAHAALWHHMNLALGIDYGEVVDLLPKEADAQRADTAISLYDLRKRYRGNFVPRLQQIIADTDGLWLAYWGDPAKKHDVFDVLELAGFQRTATLPYEHHGNPIFAYRYDRATVLDESLAEFAESITLHKAAFPDSVPRGDEVTIMLWWSAAQTPPADYSVSAFIIGQGRVEGHDGYPANGAAPATSWQPGQIVFDPHTFTVPADLPPGEYEVRAKLYTWWDGAILPLADGSVSDVGVLVGTITVH